jgi:hypothetical protein
MNKTEKKEQAEAVEHLRALLSPGDTVFTVLRHVSSSGMSRDIDLYILRDNEPLWLSGYAGRALGYRRHPQRDAIRVGGCGMDMGVHLVYSLSRTLFPDGHPCIGKGGDHRSSCPSNDHSNDSMLNVVPGALRYSSDRQHTDGGYALRHRWM